MQIHNIFRQIINWIPLFILIWPIANSYCITKNTVYPYGIGYAPIKTPHALNKPNLMILEWIRCDFFKSLAKVLWNERTALLKCQTSRPAKQELAALERIHKVDATSQANGKDYILRELASFSVPTGLCFIYPYTEGKNLAQFLSNKNWEQKANYLPQILHQTLKGLSYLQNAGIFYHDIKAHGKYLKANAQYKLLTSV
ncbi:hypothetical protein BDF19DRAFT_266990 [Syncephalis fuscata]|nr:hypothetical protein BDF19DRAFT_266990 [Syncephalis fuscata]